MKQRLIQFIVGICVVVVVISFAWWIKVNYFEAGSALVSKYTDVDAAMRLNVQGTDLRVYEFTPQTLPHVTCIFVAGDHKASLECEPKVRQ